MTERLMLAAVDQIATRGAAATSARSVAAAAGAAASAINYNFGGIEHLFAAAFGHGVEATASWQERVECDIAALPTGPAGAALALEHVIVEWTSSGRSLALLYQEALATAPGVGPAAAWTQLWRDFWRRAATRCGLGETEARLMHALFESEALYNLSSWSPALERAALRELCDHAAHIWFGASFRAPAGAFALAEQTAGVLTEGSVAPAALKIAEAAAAVVEDAGLG
ncbi:MAG: TetR family transcriptional regulator, partial [Caulobacterales bacterium]|nr:TetR family transcriptional regulator [Caulobacterales bacterium]